MQKLKIVYKRGATREGGWSGTLGTAIKTLSFTSKDIYATLGLHVIYVAFV